MNSRSSNPNDSIAEVVMTLPNLLSPEVQLPVSRRLLDAIYQHREIIDREGNRRKLHSEITRDEGELIASLIREHRFSRTLEIGCAFGISSLFICEALAVQSSPHHTMIDPGQYTEWKGVGMYHLEQAGFTPFVELIEKPSELALPQFLEQGRTFEFALIDGFHTFDHVLLDFFFVDRILVEGGIVVLDDLQLPGIRKVARYIANYPNYKVVASAKQSVFPSSWRRRLVEAPLRLIAHGLPPTARERIFDNSFLEPDATRGLVSEMVAFQKTGKAQRDSHWYRPF
ncbi:MAG: class I SAM-dependent methyltransferase [Gemmataceae bacterium]